ncbi:MAG: histidine--tRNA ligase [Bacteroidetes bacterium]|nr:histidine--tRNA ligase [Bacteroidota bacterium]
MKYKIPTGTKDVLPSDIHKWHHMEDKIRDVMTRFNYREIRTPIFEYTDLFKRGIGEATDVVGKEMYTFLDKGDESLTLRPEMTASVIRSYIENHLGEQQPLNKVYYLGPMFRQERPQKGRLRQFHQFGVEAIGSPHAAQDVETMLVSLTVYEELGLRNLSFKINSVGCRDCRPRYREELVKFLNGIKDRLSEESKNRMASNPLRILDSKNKGDVEATKNAPLMKEFLCDSCAPHFAEVQKKLKDHGIEFQIDGRLVRGLDYYTKTAYEIQSDDLGSQNALGGGGRYDLLCEDLGGKPTPSVGFAAGLERLLIVMESLPDSSIPVSGLDVYFIALGLRAQDALMPQMHAIRRRNLRCDIDFLQRSLKAQMREANRHQAKKVVIVGDQELDAGEAVIKTMETGEQISVPIAQLVEELTRR